MKGGPRRVSHRLRDLAVIATQIVQSMGEGLVRLWPSLPQELSGYGRLPLAAQVPRQNDGGQRNLRNRRTALRARAAVRWVSALLPSFTPLGVNAVTCPTMRAIRKTTLLLHPSTQASFPRPLPGRN